MGETERRHGPAPSPPLAEEPVEEERGAVTMSAIRRRVSEANAAHVAAHAPLALTRIPRLSLAVVTCVDCRLTGRLDAALGLRPGDAVVIRVAGNTFGGTDDLSRSLAAVVFDQGIRIILVVGHTECGVARIDPLSFGESVAARGVSRMALGAMPLREWLGMFRDEAENVRETVRRIRSAALFPKDVEVAGALFHVRTAEITWLDE
jgi:carbonic anhydrase